MIMLRSRSSRRSRRALPCLSPTTALCSLVALALELHLGLSPSSAQDRPEDLAEAGAAREVLYHCYLSGVLTDDDARRFKRDLERVRAQHHDPRLGYIVFEIDSDGTAAGDPSIAIDIADAIHGLKGITTAAYVVRAANGAALVATACKHLVIQEGGWLGHSGSDTAIPAKQRERAVAALEIYYNQGPRREYPLDLARALIGAEHDDLFLVPYKVAEGRNDEIRKKVLTRTRLDEMNAQEKLRFKTSARERISPEDEPMRLSAKEALEYEVSEKTVTDFEDLLFKLHFNVAREDCFDQKLGGQAVKPRSPGSQAFIDFLNHPVVRFVLLVTAFLCLMLEFKMPGTFIPGAISLGCFMIFFVAGFFPVTGAPEPATNVFELLLFFVGMALVATEIFVAPGVLFFGLLGTTVVIVSIVMAMVAPSAPLDSVTYHSAKDAFFHLVFSLSVALGGFLLLVRFLPKTGTRSGLVTRAAIKGLPTHDDVLESQEEAAALVGLRGRAITPLRPSGKIDIDGRILDVVAEGDFIDKGDAVEIIEATTFRAVVRRL